MLCQVLQLSCKQDVGMGFVCFMPDVGMGYVSLDPFYNFGNVSISLYIEECTNLIATHISTLTGRCTLGTV